MSKQAIDKQLLEFLAPALEIQAAPPPKGARAIIWALMTLLCLTIIWLCLGRIDIVATAQGQLIPKQKVKIIQPLESGVVTAIHISEGQKVHKGQLLVSLDPAIAKANVQQTTEQLVELKQQVARKRILLNNVGIGVQLDDIQLNAQHKALLNAELNQYQNEQAGLRSQIEQLRSELIGAQAKLKQIDNVLPLLKERTDALESLQNNKLVARATYLELKQQMIQMREQRPVEAANITALKNRIVSAEQEQKTHTTQLIKNTQLELSELLQQTASLQQEFSKYQFLAAQHDLVSPVSGTVEKLSLTTLGEVVTPAQQLLTIVPADDELIVEAGLLNKDIGFAYIGQTAEVKIESFPFTRYGVIEGTVVDVSTDAVEHEQLGLIFPVKVAINKQTILVEEKTVPLSAGMTVSAEIKTGQRRIIEFLLSPIIQHIDEGARER